MGLAERRGQNLLGRRFPGVKDEPRSVCGANDLSGLIRVIEEAHVPGKQVRGSHRGDGRRATAYLAVGRNSPSASSEFRTIPGERHLADGCEGV